MTTRMSLMFLERAVVEAAVIYQDAGTRADWDLDNDELDQAAMILERATSALITARDADRLAQKGPQ